VGRLLNDPLHRVCVVNWTDEELDTHGSMPGAGATTVCYPIHLAALSASAASSRYFKISTTHFKKLTTGNDVFIVPVELLSKVAVASCMFLHQVFSVSILLLDDALLKCVVTEVFLFSVVDLRH